MPGGKSGRDAPAKSWYGNRLPLTVSTYEIIENYSLGRDSLKFVFSFAQQSINNRLLFES